MGVGTQVHSASVVRAVNEAGLAELGALPRLSGQGQT